ncbi:MAG: nitroreductase family protein [Bacteroidetes bacterium]|nr:nitroreductase family protein [Bacteroidota bacterium]
MSRSQEFIPFQHPIRSEGEEQVERAAAFHALLEGRRTIRDFSDRPVDRRVIEWCIRSAGTAPSGANKQPWHFAAVSDPDVKRAIREAAEEEERAFYDGRAGEEWLDALRPFGTDANKPFLEKAPWLIAIFARNFDLDEDGNRSKNYYVPESVGIATGMLITALHQAGLSTLTHTPSPMGFLNKALDRPSHERAVILLVVGYAAEDAQVPDLSRKPLSAIASFR